MRAVLLDAAMEKRCFLQDGDNERPQRRQVPPLPSRIVKTDVFVIVGNA
jgi:hypothetical protein